MKATCPTNPNHKRFVTIAHVQEEWVVDELGSFLFRKRGMEKVDYGPDPRTTWTCNECGAIAKVEP